MSINRRGFLKLLSAAAASSYVCEGGVLAAIRQQEIPLRELIFYSIDDDAMVWRADTFLLNKDGSLREHLCIDAIIESKYSNDPDAFDKDVRQPCIQELKDTISREHYGCRLEAPSMPLDPWLGESSERWLEGNRAA